MIGRRARGPYRRSTTFGLGTCALVGCTSATSMSMALSAAALGPVRHPASTPVHGPRTSNRPAVRPPQSGDDWPEFRHDDQRTGNNPSQAAITKANVATLAPKWTHPIRGVFASAVVVNGVVYQGERNGIFSAWRLSDGHQLWKTRYIGDEFISTAEYYNGTLYVGGHGSGIGVATFYAFDASTGKVSWKYSSFPSNVQLVSSPLVANDQVYIGTSTRVETKACDTNDQLVGFALDSPTIVSTLTLTQPPLQGADIWASPMVDTSGELYVATGNLCGKNPPPHFKLANAVLKLDAAVPQMSVQWGFQSPIGPGRDADFGATPSFVNGIVVEGGKDGNVYGLDTNGNELWSTPAGQIIGSAATDGTNAYVPVMQSTTLCGSGPSPCGAFVAVSLATGKVLWSVPSPIDSHGFGVISAPAVSNGIVFTAFSGTLWALDASTGNTLWSYPVGQPTYAGMTVVNGGLLIGGYYDGSTYFCFTPGGK